MSDGRTCAELPSGEEQAPSPSGEERKTHLQIAAGGGRRRAARKAAGGCCGRRSSSPCRAWLSQGRPRGRRLGAGGFSEFLLFPL